MRETLARMAVFTVVAGLLLLAALVARREATATRPSAVRGGSSAVVPGGPGPAAAMISSEQRTRGAALFASLGCRSCHSLAGEGNPGLPLDDVGLRRDREGILAWITGSGAVAAVSRGGSTCNSARSAAPIEKRVHGIARSRASLMGSPVASQMP